MKKIFLLLMLTITSVEIHAQINVTYDAQGNRVVLDNKGFKPKITASALSVKAGKSVTVTMEGCKGAPAWSVSGNTGSLTSSTGSGSITITSKNVGSVSVQGACVYEGGCKSPLSDVVTIVFTAANTRTSADSTVEVSSTVAAEPEELDEQKEDFVIQPNPVRGQVIRMTTNLPETTLFEIFEKNGRQIPHSQQRNGNWVELIPCNTISPGVYIISALSGGKPMSRRVLLE